MEAMIDIDESTKHWTVDIARPEFDKDVVMASEADFVVERIDLGVRTRTRKEEKKKKRKEEREAKKEAQATPNVFLVTTKPPKQWEGPFGELTSPKPKEIKKRKKKPVREYVAVSSQETKSEEEIRQAPKKKGVFTGVVRVQPSGDKKENQKKESEKDQPKKTPKVTIVHKRKPKGDEQSKSETKRRTCKQKRLDAQEIIDQIINDEIWKETIDIWVRIILSKGYELSPSFVQSQNIQLPKDKESERKDEQNVKIDPPVTTPPAHEPKFDIEDTQNPPKTNVHDVEEEVEKEKGTKEKESGEAPKESGAPSGEATGEHEMQTLADNELTYIPQNTSTEDKGKRIESDFPYGLAIDTSLTKDKGI
ncbi:uncharacterized protein LOC131029186 [Cryptomeria japonica]|uniref:uncharacterized protein LOC131029186 n=1 Tax=Cryptomeria japonica TaxID=3369 RepID=UPI0025AC1BBD|nr:uncharacterized protein LOC131029186 [Cryptomeria japonica]